MLRVLILMVATFCFTSTTAVAQISFEEKPINYGKTKTNDPIAKLQQKLDSGEAKLEFDAKYGYLPSIMKALNISPTSQTLVFSRTSFQIRQISPPTPRAIYFNDESYLGWVQGGAVVEISSIDPNQGTIFYAIEQKKTESPQFVRTVGECLVCHASSRTKGVPGLLVRSVYVNRAGHPVLGTKTYSIDQKRPLEERWGGVGTSRERMGKPKGIWEILLLKIEATLIERKTNKARISRT